MIKRILAMCMVVCLLLAVPVGAQATSTSSFVGQQLFLGDDLTMHFYANLTQRHAANGVMSITVGGEKYATYVISQLSPEGNGNYDFAVNLGAAQMTQDITFTLTVSNRVVLQQTFSLRDYAQYLLDGNYDSKTKTLVRELLNYGAKAQLYFGVSTNDLANAGNELQTQAQMPEATPEVTISGEIDGVRFHGGSVLFQSRLGVRYYFNIAGDVNTYEFTINGGKYAPVKKGNLYYIEAGGIMPQEIDTEITVAVTDGENTMSFGYSPMNYIVRMYHKDTTRKEFKDMLAAANGYFQAAKGLNDTIIGNFVVPAEGYDGSEVTIKFAHTMGSRLQAVLNYHISEFNKLYPNIHIEHSSYGGWGDIASQINIEIMSDNQPNIAYCYPDHVAIYNLADATVTLDELIASQIPVTRDDGTTEVLGLTAEQIADLKAGGFYEEGSVYGDGLMYTMPMSKSTEVLYYNKTFFEANGLTVPTTWEEMEETCKKIIELDPNAIPLGYDSEKNIFINMCAQYGYDYTSATGNQHFLFNNDGCKSFAKQFRDWYQAGYITTQNLYGSYTSSLFTELDKSISHCYMSISSSGSAVYNIPERNAFEVGVASIPQVDPANPKVISQGPSLCILKGGSTTDQQVVASWLFMEYLATNAVFQTEFSSVSGYMPVIASALENNAYKAWLDTADGYGNLTALVLKNTLQNTNAYFIPAAFSGSSVASNQVGNLMITCMSTETTDVDSMIDEVFENAYNECLYQTGYIPND